MATPHTTKHKDEPEIPIPPLSNPSISGAKAQPAVSPTTLTPSLEAMHLTTISPFSTPTPAATERPVLSLPPNTRVTREEYLELKALHANAVKVLRHKGILLLFGAARTPDQVAAAKVLDESILKVKHAAELQARTIDRAASTEFHCMLIRLLMKSNKEFVEKYREFKEVVTGCPRDVWGEEVKEIERLVGIWEEKTSKEGRWPVLTKCLRGLVEKIAGEYREAMARKTLREYPGVHEEIRAIWEEELADEEGHVKKDGAESEGTESDEKRDETESPRPEVDGGEFTGGKTLAEELVLDDTTSDAGSDDEGDESAGEGDESMEYISPSKVLAKEKRQNEEGERTVSPDSPPAQSLVVADIPSTSFDFSFGAANTTMESQSITPARNNETHPVLPVPPVPPHVFTFGATNTATESQSATPARKNEAPTSTPFAFSFGAATATMESQPATPIRNNRKPPTVSTLADLTYAVQSIQVSLNKLLSATYGFDTAAQAPQSAMDAGLLMMNNFIGECVSDIRVQIKTLDTKINEIGNRLHSLSIEFTQMRDQNLLTHNQALQKEGRELAEIKKVSEVIAQQVKQMQQRQEEPQSSMSSLLAQNAKLAMEVAALKQVKSVDLEEARNLRIDNLIFRQMVERLGGKVEKFIDRLAEKEAEVEDVEDAFMEMLWPQGDGRLDSSEEGRKEVLERGLVAGSRGNSGGGWCSVM